MAPAAKLYIESQFVGDVREVTDIYWNDPNSFRFVIGIGADIARVSEYQDRKPQRPLDFRVDYPNGDSQTFTANIIGLIFQSDFGVKIEVRLRSQVAIHVLSG